MPSVFKRNPSDPSDSCHALDSSAQEDAPLTEDVLDWDSEHDPCKPKNFPPSRKWAILLTACFVSFAVGVNSTSITAAATKINDRFDVSDAGFPNSYWPVTSWNTAAGVVSMVVLPLMENFGVRVYYLVVYVVFTLFIIPQALAPNFATLVVTRAFAGACGGVLQNVVDAIIADLYDGEYARSLPMTVYVFALLGGVTFGPVFGGLVTLGLDWRWMFWIQLIIFGAFFPVVYFVLPETRPAVILANKAKAISKTRPRPVKAAGKAETGMSEIFNEAIVRPLRMLCTEPALACMTLLTSYAFGLVFITIQSAGAYVFPNTFNFTESQAGIVQLSLFIGELVGAVACIAQNKLYGQSHRINTDQPGEPIPEARLPLSIFGSFVGLTGGLFWYAWTSSPNLHWILPCIGLGFVGFGIMIVVQAVSNYITDSYASVAGSAIAAVGLGENIFAAWLPLSTERMYADLGYHWASSTLGFLAFALSFAPVVLLIVGHRVRARSSRCED